MSCSLTKPESMKKSFLLLVSLPFLSLSLSAQSDNKDPLIVVNGKISNISLNSISPDEIISVSVTKQPSPQDKELYGIMADNGVISIITKDQKQTEHQKDQTPQPLVLLDGKVFTNSLDSIIVREIETITVLKDQSATRLYGKAGENGVILIKRKGQTENQ